MSFSDRRVSIAIFHSFLDILRYFSPLNLRFPWSPKQKEKTTTTTTKFATPLFFWWSPMDVGWNISKSNICLRELIYYFNIKQLSMYSNVRCVCVTFWCQNQLLCRVFIFNFVSSLSPLEFQQFTNQKHISAMHSVSQPCIVVPIIMTVMNKLRTSNDKWNITLLFVVLQHFPCNFDIFKRIICLNFEPKHI